MAYSLEASPEFKMDYNKLCSRDAAFRRAVDGKMFQIAETAEENPNHYKPLKAPLAGKRRVHIGSFVLLFEILNKEKVIRLLRLEHHDSVYRH